MLTVTVSGQTEESIRRIATVSGISVEDVCRVLIAIPLNAPATQPQVVSGPPSPQYRTRPDLTQDQYRKLIDSLGSRTPPNAPSLEGVDLRELAYEE